MKRKSFKESNLYKISQFFEKYTGYHITPAQFYLNSQDLEIIQIVNTRTMTGKQRLANLLEAVLYLNGNSVPGDFVECGVWRGGSVMAMALKSQATGNCNRKIWLFDTFQGMTEPNESDILLSTNVPAKELINLEGRVDMRKDPYQEGVLAYASRRDVEEGIKSLSYPADNFIFVEGDVRSTLNEVEIPKQIALLRLDTDFYDSTLITLEKLWPNLVIGGVLIIDDYDSWGGSRKAVDEYFKDYPQFLMRMDTGRIVVKL